MNQSESIANLSKALAAANKVVENATKNAVNPHFKNKYADLAAVLDTVRAVYADNGLSVIQAAGAVYIEQKLHAVVETQLVHESGEWVRGTLMLPVKDPTAQGLGGAITYGRRYALAALAGIAQEDDDGNTASGAGPGPRSKPPAGAVTPARATDLEGPAAEVAAAIRLAKSLEDLAKIGPRVQVEVKDPAAVAALSMMFQERRAALSAPKAVK